MKSDLSELLILPTQLHLKKRVPFQSSISTVQTVSFLRFVKRVHICAIKYSVEHD